MSPEIYRNSSKSIEEARRHGPYGRAHDWFALGVTLFYLLSGKLPFRDKSRLNKVLTLSNLTHT